MKKFACAAVLAVLSSVAAAQGYAGALVGLSKFNVDCTGATSCDDSDTGFKVYGGYQVAPNIAIEVGYTNFGKATARDGFDGVELKASALSVVGAARLAFSPDFTGVLRLGLASVKARGTLVGVGSRSESNVELYTGLGLEYAISDELKLTAALDLTNAELGDESGAVGLFGVGVQYGF